MRILGILVLLNSVIDTIWMMIQFASVVFGLVVPEAIMMILNDSGITYMIRHWFIGLLLCILLGALFSWFCMEWSIRLQDWLEEKNASYTDAFAIVCASLSGFVAYSMILRGIGARLSGIRLTVPGGDLLIMAIQGWYILWFILFGYSVKVVWDHARKTLKEIRKG